MHRNKIREIQRAILQRTAISQALHNELVGTAEQKTGFHRAFTLDGSSR